MASLSQTRKEEIALELRRAATWVSGPRSAKLKSLADEIEGTTPDEPSEPSVEE